MLTVFFDYEGVVHHEYASAGQTINKEYTLKFWKDCVTQSEENDRTFHKLVTDFFTTTMLQRMYQILCNNIIKTQCCTALPASIQLWHSSLRLLVILSIEKDCWNQCNECTKSDSNKSHISHPMIHPTNEGLSFLVIY